MDKYTLKTAFRKSFLHVVWRIEADTSEGLLAVETRDKDSGAPLFSAFDYRTGDMFIHEKPYGDRNWTLAGTTMRKLIMRAYGANSPDGAGIACMDIDNGALLWEQFNYTLLRVDHSQLTVRHRNFAGGYEQYLDPTTGNLTPINTSPNKPTGPAIVLPQRYHGGVPGLLANFAIYGDVFHCQIGDKHVWAFHEATGSVFRVRLVITDGLVLLADKVILRDLPGITPELFFVIGQHLFTVGNNKQEIVSYLV